MPRPSPLPECLVYSRQNTVRRLRVQAYNYGMAQHINWEDRYSVGDPEMDRQHSHLLALCNNLADCAASTDLDSDTAFHDILNELAVYARTHFASEEKLLADTGYPDLTSHCDDHGSYESDLANFLFTACVSQPDKSAVHRFVLGWWLKHILQNDMAYREHLLERSL